MDTVNLFIAEIIISLTLSATTLLVLSKSLNNVLNDLCPTEKQADFWVAYTRMMLSISPLLLVLIVDGFVSSEDVLAHVRVSLMSALTGLVFGMIIVGKRIFSPAAQQCEKK